MLVEVMISIVLLATVLGLALTTLSRAHRHAFLNNDRLEALHLARQQMEKIRTNSYSQLVSKTGRINTSCTYSCVVAATNYYKDVTLMVTNVGALSQTTTVTLVTSMSSSMHQ